MLSVAKHMAPLKNNLVSRKRESDSADLPVGHGEATSRLSGTESVGTCS